MEDVTEIVLRYRAVLQNLWNTHLYAHRDLRDVELMTNFEELTLPLFKFFVWDDIIFGLPAADTIFGPNFKVIPARRKGDREILHSLMINMLPPDKPGGSWEELKGEFDADDLQLHLLDFFNWRIYYWRDYRYFRVRIDGFKSHPDRVGRDALVDVLEVTVLFNSPVAKEERNVTN